MQAHPPDSGNPRGVALITGITGQTGSYLAEELTHRGWDVLGAVRPGSGEVVNGRVTQYGREYNGMELDLFSEKAIERALVQHRPAAVFNLAANSFEPAAWEDPSSYTDLIAITPLRWLSAIANHSPQTRFFQASSGLIFGRTNDSPQQVESLRAPTTPYGVAKSFAHDMLRLFRAKYGLFACSGILYNHESPRRGEQFLTRKVTLAAARIKLNLQQTLELGSLESAKDWHYAKDTVRCIASMLEHDTPDDYIVSSGELHTVADVVRIAFEELGLDPEKHVVQNPDFFRPYETPLLGDPTKAQETLGWQRTTSFEALIRLMTQVDFERLQKSS